MASSQQTTTILIGLSGPSSSGKTTLARLLRSIFTTKTSSNPGPDSSPRTSLTILHEDDFYKTDTEIPSNTFSSVEFGTRTLEDWDCIESIDLPLLQSTLEHVKRHGRLPEDSFSKEDLNEVGESGVPEAVVQGFTEEVRQWIAARQTTTAQHIHIFLLDGFLLYPSPTSPPSSLSGELRAILAPLLDLKLFLPSTRDRTIARRARRAGYVTLEGFWADPPGYVEDCVWPNYARDHAWLFGGEVPGSRDEEVRRARENVDAGVVDREVARQEGVDVGPGCGEVPMEEILAWGVERLTQGVGRKMDDGS